MLFASTKAFYQEFASTNRARSSKIKLQFHSARRYQDAYEGIIQDKDRQEFAGMLTCMDEGIGNVTAALKARPVGGNPTLIETLSYITRISGPV